MGPQPISIVIPAFNQLDYCRQCIVSLASRTKRPYRLVLVDNGSTDGVGEYFDAVEGADVVHTGENLGFPGGTNRGLERAEGHVVMLNSDTLVSDGWLTRLERALLSADDIGMVGPVTNYAAGPQQIDGLVLGDQADVDAFAHRLAERKASRVQETHRLVGFCLMIRDAALAEVGLLDESFGLGNFEDDDYCWRMRQAGYRLAIAEDCFVFHYGGRTFDGMGIGDDEFRALMDENRQRYEAKWGVRLPGPPPPARQSMALNARAQEALAAGQPTEAVRLLKQAIATCPDVAQHYSDLGVVLHLLKESVLAYDCFVQALRADGAYEAARENLLAVGAALGRDDEVAAFLEELRD